MSFFGPDLRNGLPIGLGSLTALARAVAAVAPPPATDSFFEYVTLLLHGDGTNGAQNNTFLDGSTNNFTITRNGNTTQGSFSPFSQTGWSNYFDGTGDYLSVVNNTAFGFGSGNWTVEFWLRPSSVTGTQVIVDFRTAEPQLVPHIYLDGTSLVLNVNGAARITATSAVTINVWQHVACVKNGSSTNLYVNGVVVGSTYTDTNTYLSTAPVTIASYFGGNLVFYTGYISNLRIVKGTAVYTANFTPPTAPLTNISNTSLLTCQSNRFIDNSSNAFAITRNGDVRVEAFSPFNPSTTYSTANVGGSGYFDGTGDYLASTSTITLGTNAFTIEFWVYANSIGASTMFVAGTTTNSFQMVASGANLAFGTYNVANVLSTTTSPFVVNQWLHIVYVRSGTGTNQASIFVNGVRAVNGTVSTNYVAGAITVGGFSGGQNVTGYMSDVRVVNGTAVYDPSLTTLTVPTAPLTAITNTSLLLNFTNGGIFDNASQTVLETVGNAQVSTTQKKYGTGSMYFDGTGDYLIAPDRPALRFGTGDFTIEGWVYQTFVGTTRFFISKGTSTTGWSIGTTAAGGVLRFQYGLSSLVGATALVVNTWHHFAVVRYGSATGNLKIYFDGVLDATSAGAVNDNFNQTSVMYVGTDRTGTVSPTFEGYLDDLRITNGYARYTANFTPPTAAFPDN